MKFKADDFLCYDSETKTYYMEPEQVVRDQVEKDYWKTAGKTILKDWRLYLMLVPMLLIFFCWRYLPMYELLASFKEAMGTGSTNVADWYYVGYNHFVDLMAGSYRTSFWQAFRNTFVLSFYGLLFGFPFPIILALFFNEIKSNAYRSVIQVLTYLPKFISTVIMTTLVWMLLSGNQGGYAEPGILSKLLENIGMITKEEANKGLLDVAEYFRPIYIISGIWEGAGYGSIVYFAAIIAVSPTSYEAAQIDGAGKMQQMRFVVLPAILSTIVIMLIVRIGSLLSIGYEQVLLLKSTNNVVNAEVMSTFALGLDAKYNTIPEFVNNITSMLLVIGANMISRKASGTSLY